MVPPRSSIGAPVGRIRKLFGNVGRSDSIELGDDLLDLSSVGGSWQEAVSSVVGPPGSRDVVAYIEKGTVPGPPAGGQPMGGMVGHTQRIMGSGPESLHRYPRLILGAAAAMTPDQRDRFGKLVWLRQWDLDGVVQLNERATAAKADAADRLNVADLERFGEAVGWAPDAVVTALLSTGGFYQYGRQLLGAFEGVDELILREADVIGSVLTPAVHEHVVIWKRLGRLGEDAAAVLAPQICDAATANSKALRQVAGPFVSKLSPGLALVGLKDLAVGAKPAQRARAVQLGARVAGESGDDGFAVWAAEALAGDRAKAVQAELAELARGPEAAEARPELPQIEVAPVKRLELSPDRPRRPTEAEMLAVLNAESAGSANNRGAFVASTVLRQEPGVVAGLSGPQLARLLVTASSALRWSADRIGGVLRDAACPDPLVMSAVAESDGRTEHDVIQAASHIYPAAPDLWTPEQITPWVAYHADSLAALLDMKTDSYRFDRSGMFALMEAASSMPARLQDALVAAAVAGYKSDRADLHRVVGVECTETVLAYLASRKRAERLGAAEWIRGHPSPGVGARLREAARAEKDDGAKAAMLSALEALDEPIDEFLSPEALARDAEKALAKKSAIPKSLEWLDMDSLPGLFWADGSPVAVHIAQWFLATAVKAKTAEPSPILRRHFDNMDPAAVRTFGSILLDLWMAEDLRTCDEAEAQAIAQQQAPHRHRWGQQGHPPYVNMTLQQVTDALYLEARQQVAGSAASSKGLLAVVAAAAGPEVADRALAYIRKHRGHRVSQAKALLQMLAWIDEPTTVQAVMAIATRFRPKGIQNEATEQAQLLAERHGWTLDDLADRSIPSGGFEANGRQVIDYGTRTFTAHLGDDLSVSLVNDETGKTVRSLPKGRADDDPELIADAKKDFAAAKKEVKSAATLQPERLHLAMCAQRSWTADEYTRYFINHPVMIRLATRLVWLATASEASMAFRPLTDGTLVGVDDDDVTLGDEQAVTIAHDQVVGPGEAPRWQQHLTDYEVEPLFAQFGRPAVAVTATQTVIDDFVGFVHNDGSLRGQMNRHAWQLGVPQDAGIVYELVKDVPSSSLKAVVELHGGIPAGAWDVGSWKLALGQLFFVNAAATYFQATDAVKLSEVPPILLAEVFAETQAMAQAGEGHDPDYAKKVGG